MSKRSTKLPHDRHQIFPSSSPKHKYEPILLLSGLFLLTGLGLLFRKYLSRGIPVKRALTDDTSKPVFRGDEMESSEHLRLLAPSQQSITNLKTEESGLLSKPQHILFPFLRHFRSDISYPITVQGVALYSLWDQNHTPINPPSKTLNNVWIRSSRVGLWPTTRLVWYPKHAGRRIPTLTAREAKQVISELLNHQRVLASVNSKDKANSPLIYTIILIDKFYIPKPVLYRFYSRKGKAAINRHIADLQRSFAEDIRPLCGLAPEHTLDGWLPNVFNHYDRSNRRRGYLVISPTRALMTGMGDVQARILASQIQPRDVNILKGSGIIPERYQEVLARISFWNSAQDNFEAVDQLKDLIESGQTSIDGQALLNFALAAIGIFIALFSGQTFHSLQIASLVLLIGASLMFWLYARSGSIIYQLLGWLCAAMAILLALGWLCVILPVFCKLQNSMSYFFACSLS